MICIGRLLTQCERQDVGEQPTCVERARCESWREVPGLFGPGGFTEERLQAWILLERIQHSGPGSSTPYRE